MATVTVGKENLTPVDLHYEDHGFGSPVVPRCGASCHDNDDLTGGTLVSQRVGEENWNVAVSASVVGTVACVDGWIEDFRPNIARNTVPTLILHGELRTHADQINSELARLLS